MATNRLLSNGSLTAGGVASGVDGDFPLVRTACTDTFAMSFDFMRLEELAPFPFFYFFSLFFRIAWTCFEIIGVSSGGTTLGIWKATIHLGGLKPSGTLCVAFGGTP
jgi:hypothetical protein